MVGAKVKSGGEIPIPLPMEWAFDTSGKDNNNSMLSLSKNGLRVSYVGPGHDDKDAAAIRSNVPIPREAGIYYFEVTIISKGHSGWMGIGICEGTVSLNRLPGWDKRSWGYHGDDGCSFTASGQGKKYGPTYATGDVIGCRVNFLTMSVAFVKNGMELGNAFEDLDRNAVLYATIGMRTPGEVMEVNFGQSPFRYDIDTYVQDERARLWSSIQSNRLLPPTPTPPTISERDIERSKRPSLAVSNVLNPLIQSYLVHNGYLATAESFKRNAIDTWVPDGVFDLSKHDADVQAGRIPGRDEEMDVDGERGSLPEFVSESMKMRQDVKRAILGGDIPSAISLVEKHHPTLLEKNPHIHFALLCREFIEHIATGASTHPSIKAEANDSFDLHSMEIGSKILSSFDPTRFPSLRAAIDETFSLMAHEDPAASPCGYLVENLFAGREAVSSVLDKELLAEAGEDREARLEVLLRQAVVVGGHLQELGMSLVDVWRDVLDC
ncbi:hypothetical protein HDU67_003268 [Dinochytrium kinnereticum]|nr:hypothetical protein HDU67_003268 [Dinochytrium kinnereticum]